MAPLFREVLGCASPSSVVLNATVGSNRLTNAFFLNQGLLLPSLFSIKPLGRVLPFSTASPMIALISVLSFFLCRGALRSFSF